jgi:hypothetical protein
MLRHLEASRRSAHAINLDPGSWAEGAAVVVVQVRGAPRRLASTAAAEHFDYPIAWDVRDVISVDDVAEVR